MAKGYVGIDGKKAPPNTARPVLKKTLQIRAARADRARGYLAQVQEQVTAQRAAAGKNVTDPDGPNYEKPISVDFIGRILNRHMACPLWLQIALIRIAENRQMYVDDDFELSVEEIQQRGLIDKWFGGLNLRIKKGVGSR